MLSQSPCICQGNLLVCCPLYLAEPTVHRPHSRGTIQMGYDAVAHWSVQCGAFAVVTSSLIWVSTLYRLAKQIKQD